MPLSSIKTLLPLTLILAGVLATQAHADSTLDRIAGSSPPSNWLAKHRSRQIWSPLPCAGTTSRCSAGQNCLCGTRCRPAASASFTNSTSAPLSRRA